MSWKDFLSIFRIYHLFIFVLGIGIYRIVSKIYWIVLKIVWIKHGYKGKAQEKQKVFFTDFTVKQKVFFTKGKAQEKQKVFFTDFTVK